MRIQGFQNWVIVIEKCSTQNSVTSDFFFKNEQFEVEFVFNLIKFH